MNSVHRRELLAAFLGAPALLTSGCGRSTDSPLPPGELRDPSIDLGHRLRGRLQAPTDNGPTDPEKIYGEHQVIIVGAGIAGLAAARRLESAGVNDFLVLELEPKPGGTSTSGRSPVTAYPWGAHYLPSPRADNEPLVDFLEELGAFEGRDDSGQPIPQEHWLVRDPETRVCYKGIWYEGLFLTPGASEQDLAEFARFESLIDEWVAFRDDDGRRAFTIPSSQASRDPRVMELDQLSMAAWLGQHGFQSARLKWYVDYACRDDYGMRSETTSAWAGIFYFAARRDMPGGASQPFLTWPQGNDFLVEQMFRPLRSRALTGWAAARIDKVKEARSPHAIEVLAINADGLQRTYRAQRVLFAAPRFLAPYLIPHMPAAQLAACRRFEYGPWAVANLHVRNRPQGVGFPLCWDNVFYDSPSLGYVVATHQQGPELGPTVLTYYYPLAGENARDERARLLSATRDDWAEIALSDLQVGHPDIRSSCERIDVCRWGHAMIRPTPGFVSSREIELARRPVEGVHFAHSDLSGLPLFEEAFDHGWRAAGEIVDHLREGAL